MSDGDSSTVVYEVGSLLPSSVGQTFSTLHTLLTTDWTSTLISAAFILAGLGMIFLAFVLIGAEEAGKTGLPQAAFKIARGG